MRTVYQTDGTISAFYTAVFDAYKDETAYLTSSSALQSQIGEQMKIVATNEEKATRVQNKIRALDTRALGEIDFILRTPFDDREQTAFSYIKRLVQHGAPVRGFLALPEIRKAMDYYMKTSHEKHILSGFLRFHETENGILYSAYAPDNDITSLLMPHFLSRLKNTPFIIHDTKRHLAGLSNGRRWQLVPVEQATVRFSKDEDDFLSLWSKYYQTVAIKERKNSKLMKNFMPVRYWKFMPEKQAEEERLLRPFIDD